MFIEHLLLSTSTQPDAGFFFSWCVGVGLAHLYILQACNTSQNSGTLDVVLMWLPEKWLTPR